MNTDKWAYAEMLLIIIEQGVTPEVRAEAKRDLIRWIIQLSQEK